MFKHLLSSIGFGQLVVDTVVEKNHFSPDEHINGMIKLNSENHEVDHVEIQLIERMQNEDETSEFSTVDQPLQKLTLSEVKSDTRFTLHPPYHIHNAEHQFYIMTRVYLNEAVDLYDEDEIYFTSNEI